MLNTIVVCVQDSTECSSIASMISEYTNSMDMMCDIITYNDGIKFTNDCINNIVEPSLLFVDINMDSINGIEITKVVNENINNCYVVYVADDSDRFTDIYTTRHDYFVLKSQLQSMLPQVFNKIIYIDSNNLESVVLPLKGSGIAIVKKSDFIYAERVLRNTRVHTTQMIIDLTIRVDELENIIYGDEFVRCHNSYLVSFRYIQKYKRDKLLLEGNIVVPVSRKFQQDVHYKYHNWLKS